VKFVSQIVTEVRKREQAIPRAPIIWSLDEFVFTPVLAVEPDFPDLSGELFRIRTKRNLVWIPEPLALAPTIHRTIVWVPEPLSFGPPVCEIEIPIPEPEPIPEPPPPDPVAPGVLPVPLPGVPGEDPRRLWYARFPEVVAMELSNNEIWCKECASHIPHVRLSLDTEKNMGRDRMIFRPELKKMRGQCVCALCLHDII
jgi:hypothetical protein